MESATYFELHLKDVSRADEDLISEVLFSYGAMGVSENLQFHQEATNYQPQIVETETLSLVAYFSSLSEIAPAQEQLQTQFPGVRLGYQQEQEKDWLEEWKKGFNAFELCQGYWIVPSWCEPPVEAKHCIYIDPGMAFGTGTHETTQVCSEILCDYLSKNKIESAFDLGTGTGVLAILMEKMGVPVVEVNDIDLECERVTKENFDRNQTKKCAWSETFSTGQKPYGLIVANIIDGVLLTLKENILHRCDEQTILVLSGVLEEREEEFLSGFLEDTTLVVKTRRQKGEWCGYLLVFEPEAM